MTTFVDRVVLHVAAGNGGHGVASVKREKFKPLGGPDGGNGGKGGSVILAVDPQSTTLLDYHHTPHRKATNGKPGGGDERNGADGGDLVLPVPEGTVVKDGNGSVLADLVGHDATFVVARGGRGGLGNKALASPRRKAPGFALLGEPGESIDIVLELKSLADVALIGFPSAGKSSLVSVMSAARPKIADYPFTTLVPNLGVVTAGSQRFTMADVPGLIPGASEGKGLGLEFLRHVERCSVLVHVVDCATLEPGRDPMTDLEVIEAELAAYVIDDTLGGRPLSDRTRIIVLNKSDVPDALDLAEMVRPLLEEKGLEVHIVSAVAHTGLKELTFALARHVLAARAEIESRVMERPRVVIRPVAVDDAGFLVRRENTPDGEVFRVLGERPRRWINQTDFSNDEAVGLPRRPAQPARRRGGPAQGRCRLGLHGADRPRGQRRGLRLGADHVGRRRAARRTARQRRAARGRGWPQDPRRAARALPRPQGRPDRGSYRAGAGARRRALVVRGRRGLSRMPGTAAAPAAHRGRGSPPRREGGVVVADHGRRRSPRPGRARRARRRAGGTPGGRAPGGARVVGCDRGGDRAAGAAPAAVRPGHPAGGGVGGAGGARRGLPGGVLGARAHRRAGAAHRRRRHPAHPLHERAAHPGAAARARHRADRQRERHRGHPRDPLRRQRPAGGAGVATWWPPTGWCCSPTSTRSTTGRPRGVGPGGCRSSRRPRTSTP